MLLLVLLVVLPIGCDDDEMRVAVPGGNDPPVVAPARVRLVPSQATYQVGEPIVLEIVIDNARDVGSIAFHLAYDPQVLAFVPPGAEGPFMASDGADTVFLASAIGGGGEIVAGMSRIHAPDGVDGTGTLAVFEFNSIASGDCSFRFSGASVKDPQSRALPAAFNSAPVRVE
jgi:hypothetical protein